MNPGQSFEAAVAIEFMGKMKLGGHYVFGTMRDFRGRTARRFAE